MSWAGFEILFHNYPEFRGEIEKLQDYVKETNLKIENILDLSHASSWTNIPKNQLKEIFENGVNLRLFQKIYRLKCNVRDGFVAEQEIPFYFPLEIFCDLCGEEHEFTEEDIEEGYRLKFVISNGDLKLVRNSMPLLCYYANKFTKEFGDVKRFHNRTFLIVLHFLKDIMVFLEACEKLGLEPYKTYVFWKPYLYPHKDDIILHLNSKGYNVQPLQELENVLEKLNESNLIGDIVVAEDGGYIVPLLHNRFHNLLKKTIGAVEQTTRGIRNDKQVSTLNIPIFSVAEADMKMKIEPPHVADAVVHNIERLLSFEKFRGEKVALMGYGTIGIEIAERLRNKVNLIVYDPRSEKRTGAREKGLNVVAESYNVVKDKFLVIGCSGETSINEKEILSLRHKTYLVSASSDQREIGLLALEALSGEKKPLNNPDENKKIGTSYIIREKGNEINLLADGYPINFWYSESMPNQVSDLILTLIFLSCIEICTTKYEKGIKNVDTIATKHKLAEMYENQYGE